MAQTASGRTPVVAIGLDGCDPGLLERWLEAGELPHLAALRARGCYARLEGRARYSGGSAPYASTEGLWVSFQTGVRPSTSGYWETVRYDPQRYTASNDPVHGGYDYRDFRPFYALGPGWRVATFDVPVGKVCADVDGIQVVGWGGHFPFVVRGSAPQGLLPELEARFGRNPILYRDAGPFWSRRYLRWLQRASSRSLAKRSQICTDLLRRGPWDLFLAVFGESHGAAHDFWWQHDPEHPLFTGADDDGRLLEVFRQLDGALGTLQKQLPEDAHLVCFSVHGMRRNVSDLASFFFLPELLYRAAFPGQRAFEGRPGAALPPPRRAGGRTWYGEIWKQRCLASPLQRALRDTLPPWLYHRRQEPLLCPYQLDRRGAASGWLPAQWYQPAWHKMRAFALPAFSDGHIRINLAGREARGLVQPEDYQAECARLRELLLRVRDARSGQPVVQDVLRTRGAPRDDDPRLPLADLVVVWTEQPFDGVDSPDVGRIGPVPYNRTGGHSPDGFMMAAGPGLPRGQTLEPAEAIDLAPTLLKLLGAPLPQRLEGRPLL